MIENSWMQEGIGLQGWVRLYANGELMWEGSNLVVDAGKNYCAKLLGGTAVIINPTANPTVSYETVDTIRIGNGGSVNLVSQPTIPDPPTTGDTALDAEIVKSTGGPYTQNASISIATNTVTFTASVFSDDLVNGDFPNTDGATPPVNLFVNEAGLYVNAPESSVQVMFARVTFPSIAFAPTSGTTLSIEWIVGYL